MVLQDVDFIFDTLDIECNGYIEWIELQDFDKSLFYEPLDIDQLEAAIKTVCGSKSNGRCKKEYFPDLVKEVERRHFMEEKVRWDFLALDVEKVGRIPIKSALFLFKAVHGDRFSQRSWNNFVDSRTDPHKDVNFDEIKIHLCNIPEFASGNGDKEFVEQEKNIKERSMKNLEKSHKILQEAQEDESTITASEQQKLEDARKLKNKADNLLNRMDEIGIEALLEDDVDNMDYGGRAKEKVSASELLDALKEKYAVVREHLLTEMLRKQVGEGMWQAMSEHEQYEKLLQLKVKEEKLRRDGKLDTMVIHLPGSRIAVEYNVFGLMGESNSELDNRITQEEEKANESGLSSDEISIEFSKKLDAKEKENSSTEQLLLDLNSRFTKDHDILSKKLQGLNKYKLLTPAEREEHLFSLVQARLRGAQESRFVGASVSVGLSERIQPVKQDRSSKDGNRHYTLSEERIKQHKSRKAYDGPVVPPKLFPVKAKQGRVDLALQLVQECERRYALEREFLLTIINSRNVQMYRSSARKLNEDERQKQLAVLLAQWKGCRGKRGEERKAYLSVNRKYLEEACALRFESVKHVMEGKTNKAARDNDVAVELLARLQKQQDQMCRKILDVGRKDKTELEDSWREQVNAVIEEWFHNVAVVLFDIIETTEEEEELLKALNGKYDSLRDKLLLDSLMNQHGKAEWDRLSEQERQNELARLRMLEKKLRKEGKYDELAKLLGDSAANAELLGKLLGEGRQKYLDKLNDRLRNRQRRIENGEDPDEIDAEEILEQPDSSTGNILKDLDKRFEDERDALLRKLREEQDRQKREQDRQAELARLRLEARKAEREANFDGAALVLGLAERNKAALEDRLKSDRERQEQLARERLAARRNKKKTAGQEEDVSDSVEPAKDDITGWQDSVLKEMERKHLKERNLLLDLLQESEAEDLRQEARDMSEDEQQQRLNKLQGKRKELDLSLKADQEEHIPILEMALSIKYVRKNGKLNSEKSEGNDVTTDDVIIAIIADLQQVQDDETRRMIEILPNKSQEELAALRSEQIEAQTYQRVENVVQVAFAGEGGASDEIVKALDKKYDTLMDKLLLEALQQQMGEAEWAKLNEQERQRLILKKRLEQKRLLKEGRFDEAARLLGEGFKTDANLKNLMGENRKKYQELLEERLKERQERLARGEPVDDLLQDELPEELQDSSIPTDAKALLEDLQKRYDAEKDELLARLHGSTSKFMSERDRQAELARLRREQRRAQQEEKFGAAALLFGLAERNQNAAQERLQNDRLRQEKLAKERLERLRNKRASRQEEEKPDQTNMDALQKGPELQEALMKSVDERQTQEQMQMIELYQNKNTQLIQQYDLMTMDQRQMQLETLFLGAMEEDKYGATISDMMCLKYCNRFKALTTANKQDKCSDDNLLVSLLADLQQTQDKESEEILNSSIGLNKDQMLELQQREIKMCESKQFPNIPKVLASIEELPQVDTDVLVEALESKYDTLKDKLILEALEKQMGAAKWAEMNERQRQQELLKLKLQEKKLKQEGKMDEADRLMKGLLQRDTNLKSLLGATKEEQERRLKERLEKRKERQAAGMNDEEIQQLEEKEDEQFEQTIAKQSTGNALQDLQKNFEAEKEALLNMLNTADTKLNNERKRQLELARMRREARKAQAEQKFDAAALVLGMANSQQAALNDKLKSDRTRQEQLARERIQALKNKRQQQSQEQASIVEENVEDIDDVVKLQELLLSNAEKKHTSERDLLINLLQQHNNTPSQLKELPPEEQEAKLFELKEQRKQWRSRDDADTEEHMGILKDAVALRFEKLKRENVGSEGKAEDVNVKILADLQDQQDAEAGFLMKDLSEKDIATVKQLIKIQLNSHQKQFNDNLACALFGGKLYRTQSSDSEDELMDALKEKYDSMKEKIFEEALKAKFGEEAWNQMTEKEKQEHILAMKINDQFNNNDQQMSTDLDSITLPGMEKIIGKTRAKQEKKMKERMERRKQAKLQGKSEDEIAMEELQEDQSIENDEQKGTELLKDLQKQFEEEKNAILGMLQTSDTQRVSERERQLALLKLRRDRLKIQKEEKYDGAALIMNLAKSNQAKKDASLENERGRQEQLARERIAALKRRKEEHQKKGAGDKSEAEKLAEEGRVDASDDLSSVEQMQREGTLALQDAVLNEMEKKHNSEQDALLDMINNIPSEDVDEAMNLSEEDRKEKLNLVSIQNKRLKDQSNQFLSSQPPENTMSEEEKTKLYESIASDREKKSNVLKDGLSLKLADTKTKLKSDTVEETKLNEEVQVALMADLQERQTHECNALVEAMKQLDKETIERLKNEQRKARCGGWMDNIASVLFDEKKDKGINKELDEEIANEIKAEEENLQKEAEKEMADFQEKMEQEKKKLATMSDDEINSFMKELKAREEEKRKAIQDQIDKQRQRAKERMNEKRKKREEKEYESDLASALIVNAKKRSDMLREKTMAAQGAQKDSLEERLRKRREERKKRQEEEAEKARQEVEAEKARQEAEKQKLLEQATEKGKPPATEPTTSSATDDTKAQPQETKKKKKLPNLPGGGMKREKTVVEKAAEITDSQKQKMINMMMREQTTMAKKIDKEQKRQEEIVRELREKRRKKMELRNEEAAKLIGLGARQKTMVEDKKKVERERQIDQIRERVNRIRRERTQVAPTTTENGQQGESFAKIAAKTGDDKMERLAQEMEKKFKNAGMDSRSPTPNPETTLPMDEETTDEIKMTGRGKIDENTRQSIMKERQKERKNLRQGSQVPPTLNTTENTASDQEDTV